MIDDAHLKDLAERALTMHIPTKFRVEMLNVIQVRGSVVDWAVQYPDGAQIGGTVHVHEDAKSYALCVSMRYNPTDREWSYPYSWHHGNLPEVTTAT